MLPRALVFDLDGTLVESAPDLADSLNSLLVSHGLPRQDLSAVKQMVGAGAKMLLQRGFAASGQPLSEAEAEALMPAFLEDYSARATNKTRLMPGTEDLLAALAGDGVALGVCTNKPEGISRAILKDLGVAQHFGSIVGGDTTPGKKPDPRPLLATLDTLGAGPAESLMVGDSPADAGVARAVGTGLALVTFGYTQVPVEELGADFLIDHFDQLLPALRAAAA